MNKPTSLLCAIALASISVAISTTQAHAASIVRQPTMTDLDFNKLITNKDFVETYVAQSRIGNNANNGTQEIDLLNASNNLLPVAQANNVWTNGQAVDFTLTYKNSIVTYIVDGKTLSSSKFSGSVTDLFFRTRSAANSSMLLSELKFTDGKSANLAVGSIGSSGADVDYLQLSNISGDFTLTGKSTMAWNVNSRPNNSGLAYQIKVGTTRKVPEPKAVSALAIVGLAGIVARKRQKAKQINEI